MSDGPNGEIKKAIVFTEISNEVMSIYNLAFGDLNATTGDIDDMVISNNRDRDKVLATVASTVHDFCDKNGNHLIFAQGSTAARTRLYQMSIAANYDELMKDFDIKGLTKSGWQQFQRSVNYEAFLANRK